MTGPTVAEKRLLMLEQVHKDLAIEYGAVKARAEAAEKELFALQTQNAIAKGDIELLRSELTLANARAEAAEKALHELTEPISDAGHTTADGLRHEMGQLRARAEAAEKQLQNRGLALEGAEEECAQLVARAEAAEKLLRRLVDACGYVRPINGDVCMEKVTDMRNAMKFIEAVEAARVALEAKP
jgi:chromosome segregation ATPase